MTRTYHGHTLPDPPAGYSWDDQYLHKTLTLRSVSMRTAFHRGWLRSTPNGEWEIIVRRTGGGAEQKRVTHRADSEESAIIMLHTLICLGEPT